MEFSPKPADVRIPVDPVGAVLVLHVTLRHGRTSTASFSTTVMP